MDEARGLLAALELVRDKGSMMWSLRLPISPKVKHLMWRLGRNCLPNRQRLVSKGIDYHSNRVICNPISNTIDTCFYAARTVLIVGRNSTYGLVLRSSWREQKDLTKYSFAYGNSWTNHDWLILPWHIGVHGKRGTLNCGKIKTRLSNMYCIKNRGWMAEWQSARHARYSADPEQQQAVTQWQHPPSEFIKCNSDAMTFTLIERWALECLWEMQPVTFWEQYQMFITTPWQRL
jgi:hypothetical protein